MFSYGLHGSAGKVSPGLFRSGKLGLGVAGQARCGAERQFRVRQGAVGCGFVWQAW